MAIYFGQNPPFIGGSQKVMSRQEDARLVKNDIIQLLLTTPGERIHNPDFGTPIKSSLFDQSDRSTYTLIAHDIREAISRFEPRIASVQVIVEPGDSEHVVLVKVAGVLTIDPTVVLELEQAVSVGA